MTSNENTQYKIHIHRNGEFYKQYDCKTAG